MKYFLSDKIHFMCCLCKEANGTDVPSFLYTDGRKLTEGLLLTEEKQRKPLMTTRQIGLAAAFGGAAFAFRALGIAVSLFPPLVVDPGALMPCLAGMAAGPLVGIVVGIARGIPSGLPVIDLWMQPLKGVYWAFVYKYGIMRIKNPRTRWPVFWIVTAILQFFVEAPAFIGAESVILGIFPFYPTWPIVQGWYYILYSGFQILLFSAVIAALPDLFGWKEGKAPW